MKRFIFLALFASMLSSGHGFEAEQQRDIEYPISSSIISISDGIIPRDLNVVILKKDTVTFKTGSTYPSDSDFFINANFFDKSGPIGLLVVDKKVVSKKTPGGGCLYVKSGKTKIGKRCPVNVEFNAQTLLLGIVDGKINSALIEKSHSMKLDYRTVIGETQGGDIILVASTRTGIVTIEEILTVAIERGVINGILFDGGSSVEYGFLTQTGRNTFKSIPGIIKKELGIEEPKSFVYGKIKG